MTQKTKTVRVQLRVHNKLIKIADKLDLPLAQAINYLCNDWIKNNG